MTPFTSAIGPVVDLAKGPSVPSPREPPLPPAPHNPARTVGTVLGAIGSLAALPLELANTGFAAATSEIAAAYPALPAATMMSLYIAPPHGHLHPPSLNPPATVPIPLPSLGPVIMGTCLRVQINMPATRAGDLGTAATCVGVCPMFETSRRSRGRSDCSATVTSR